jgi:hypothetical protein
VPAAQYTVNKTKLDEFSMVFYNNLLSLPLIAALMWWYGEIEGLLDEPALRNPVFLIAAGSSALVRMGVSPMHFWCGLVLYACAAQPCLPHFRRLLRAGALDSPATWAAQDSGMTLRAPNGACFSAWGGGLYARLPCMPTG